MLIGFMRKEGSARFEAAIKTSNNLHQLRRSAAPYTKRKSSVPYIQPSTGLLSNLMKRLKLNDQLFQVFQCSDVSEIDAAWEISNQVDSTLGMEDTTRSAVRSKQAFTNHCCQV